MLQVPTGKTLSQILDLPLADGPVAQAPVSLTQPPPGGELQYQMVILLLAMDIPVGTVATKTGLSSVRVEQIRASEDGAENIVRMQAAMWPDPKQRIKKTVNMALDTKIKLMLTAKSESVRNAASTDLLDRDMGKAVQMVENRNVNFDAGNIDQLDRAIAAAEERLLKHQELERKISASRQLLPIPAELLQRS